MSQIFKTAPDQNFDSKFSLVRRPLIPNPNLAASLPPGMSYPAPHTKNIEDFPEFLGKWCVFYTTGSPLYFKGISFVFWPNSYS